MTLKELRKQKGLTQNDAAKYIGVSLRTYQYFEAEPEKQKGPRFEFIVDKLNKYGYVDENTGVLDIQKIGDICRNILPKYDVSYCYLFGSYAKGYANPESDVDLFINTETTGLRFFEMIEELREALHKKVDVIDQRQGERNFALVNEILKDGVKLYG